MLISVKTTRPIFFFFFNFFHQKKRNYYSGNFKHYQPEMLLRSNARAEKTNVGYHGTPFVQLSVNMKKKKNMKHKTNKKRNNKAKQYIYIYI